MMQISESTVAPEVRAFADASELEALAEKVIFNCTASARERSSETKKSWR